MREVRIESLVKKYGKDLAPAVDSVDLQVAAGEFLVLLGPSGCGKTTLLRCLAGLERPTSGTISFGEETVFDAAEGTSLPPERRQIGMVFQNYSLWPHMSVAKNVGYPLRARRVPRADQASRVDKALRTVQCEALAKRLPAQLSGGQQQRIALARALVADPQVMLLDEPLSNLDALLRVDLRDQLRDLHRELGFTSIYVTHDQSEAFTLGTRVAVMRAGRIEQLGTPEEVYTNPASEYVASFLGIRNSFSLHREGGQWRGSLGVLDGALLDSLDRSQEYRCFTRPEHIRLRTADAPATDSDTLVLPAGRVVDAVFAGSAVEYVVAIDGETVHATSTSSHGRFAIGQTVQCSIDAEHCILYSDQVRVPVPA